MQGDLEVLEGFIGSFGRSAHLYELNAVREVLDQVCHRLQLLSLKLGIEPVLCMSARPQR